MSEELITQDLTSILAFGQLKIRIYLETASKKLDDETAAVTFGISAVEAAKALRQADETLFNGLPNYEDGLRSFVRRWVENPDTNFIGMAELYTRFMLSLEDVEILAMLTGMAINPALCELCGFAVGDHALEVATIGVICRILANQNQDKFDKYLARLSYNAPLRHHCLISVEKRLHPQDGFDRLHVIAFTGSNIIPQRHGSDHTYIRHAISL